MRTVALREITNENRDAVVAIRVAPSQERFVGTVDGALTDAQEIPQGKPWCRAIYAHDQPVGFVMLSWNVTPDPPRIIGPWFLWKLLVDEDHQRCGYGHAAVRLVADIVRANGAADRTGDLDENDEIILALDLGVQRQSSIR